MLKKFLVGLILFVLKCNLSFAKYYKPDTVVTGTYIMSLHDINFHDNEYTIRLWLWMLYNNPQFDFANRVEVTNAKSIEKPDLMVDSSDNKIWVLMKMKCIMKQLWRVQDYPFDKQSLVMHIENSEFDTRSLVFKADTNGAHSDPELTVNGWQIKNIEVKTGIKNYKTAFGDVSLPTPQSEYSSFEILINIERNATGLFFKLFLGMYVAFAIAFLSFFIHMDHVEAGFGLQVGGLFAAVGNKYIIDSILPETPVFTLVDSLHAVTFVTIFLIILVSSIALSYFKKGQKSKAERVEKVGAFYVFCFFAFANAILVGIAVLN